MIPNNTNSTLWLWTINFNDDNSNSALPYLFTLYARRTCTRANAPLFAHDVLDALHVSLRRTVKFTSKQPRSSSQAINFTIKLVFTKINDELLIFVTDCVVAVTSPFFYIFRGMYRTIERAEQAYLKMNNIVNLMSQVYQNQI